MKPLRAAFAFAILLGACGAEAGRPTRAHEPQPVAARRAGDDDAACERRTGVLLDRVAAALELAQPQHPPSILLANHDGLPRDPAVEVHFLPNGAGFVENQVARTGEVVAAVQELMAARQVRAIAVVLPGAMKLAPLLPALEGLSEIGEVQVVVGRPGVSRIGVPSPDAPSGILDLLEVLDSRAPADERAAALTDAFTEALGTCVPAAAALTWTRDPAARVEVLAAIVDGLDECGCRGADVDALENLVLMTVHARPVERGWLRLSLRPDGTPVDVTGDRIVDFVRALAEVPLETRRAGVWVGPRP